MSVPCGMDGEYFFSHAYYPQCEHIDGNVELYTIQEVHEWCEAHSKEHSCSEIRVEHVIHWQADDCVEVTA